MPHDPGTTSDLSLNDGSLSSPARLDLGVCWLGKSPPSSCLTARWGRGWVLVGPQQPHPQSTGNADLQGPSGRHPLADWMPPQMQTAACPSQTVTCNRPSQACAKISGPNVGVNPLTDKRGINIYSIKTAYAKIDTSYVVSQHALLLPCMSCNSHFISGKGKDTSRSHMCKDAKEKPLVVSLLFQGIRDTSCYLI